MSGLEASLSLPMHRLGQWRRLSRVSGEAPPFSPLDLSPALWLDASDATTLFQDSAGTTPATAPGDPVGLLRDKSGNDLHMTQETTAAKPTLNTADFGRLALSFDGGDSLSGAYNPPNSTLTMVVVFRFTTVNVNQILLAHQHVLAGLNTDGNSFVLAPFMVNRSIPIPVASTLTEKAIFVFHPDRDAGWRNGAPLTYTNANRFEFGSNSTFYLGARSTGTNMTGYVGELIAYNRILEDEERQLLEAYLASKWGVTLS